MGEPVLNAHDGALIAELTSAADEVFGNHDAASRWLETALWELDNLPPREIVIRSGRTGFERAHDVLVRIEYGVYS